VAALDEAVDAARAKSTGSDDISMMGSLVSGGITSTAYFSTLGGAAEKIKKHGAGGMPARSQYGLTRVAFGCLITTLRRCVWPKEDIPRLRGIGRWPRSGTDVCLDCGPMT